ncbi:LysR family transcriptional regulator [Actinomadura sp. DC4]|uniref:LysR family transcriptional regulator n=1 Tax=Actinomadura sp. DC4 TaxID=3055069 RepID=UPI0025AF2A9E|nr:LysR family transcriptional regulator [Actinomadura sp. DC4]MDN3357666.1 LysR family transcriptional regulator [Actinomadura sp. DC4]
MELRQLNYFVAVANEKSFTLAAKRLHVVQSAVSAAIASLERDLRVTLFERNAQRVVLTEAGAALLPEALAVLDAAQGARDAVDELGRGVRGSVRVGSLAGLDLVDLPALAGDFRRRYPGVELRLRVETTGSAGIVAALLNGEVDVGFLGVADTVNRDLCTRELLRVPQVLAVPAGHPLARRRTVAVSDLAEEDFVDFPPGYASRAVTDQVFAAARIERRIAVEVGGVENAADFVRHGVGVAIVPPFAVRGDEAVRTVKVKDEPLEWSLHLATTRKRKPTAAVRALTGLVDAHLRQPENRA